MNTIKKSAAKRKHSKIFKNIQIFFIIFFICLIILIGVFTILKLKPNKINNPIVKTSLNNQTKLNNNTLSDLLKKNNLNYIQISNNNFTLDSGTKVYLNLNLNLNSQISSLQLILTHFTIEGKTPRVVDFRFEQPVVSF